MTITQVYTMMEHLNSTFFDPPLDIIMEWCGDDNNYADISRYYFWFAQATPLLHTTSHRYAKNYDFTFDFGTIVFSIKEQHVINDHSGNHNESLFNHNEPLFLLWYYFVDCVGWHLAGLREKTYQEFLRSIGLKEFEITDICEKLDSYDIPLKGSMIQCKYH